MGNQSSKSSLITVLVIFGILIASASPALLIIIVIGILLWYILIKKDYLTNFPNLMQNSSSLLKIGAIITVLAIILFVVIRFIIVIPPGKVGVYELFGTVSTNELPSGLHLVNPLGKVTLLDIRTQEYTMTVTQGEGRHATYDAIAALTKEGLSVDFDITVLYHLQGNKAPSIYKDIGLEYDEKIIRPVIRGAIRDVASQYEAREIYSEKRTESTNKIKEVIISSVEPRGFTVEEVILRNVALPAKLTASIEEKLTADQEAQRMEFVLLKENKEAERKVIEATGQRDAQKIINESLTDRYLDYLYINSLKDRQGTIYVPISPSNGMPLYKNIP